MERLAEGNLNRCNLGMRTSLEEGKYVGNEKKKKGVLRGPLVNCRTRNLEGPEFGLLWTPLRFSLECPWSGQSPSLVLVKPSKGH